MSMKVHNADLFVECMNSADWTPSSATTTTTAKSSSPKKRRHHGSDGKKQADLSERAKEAFAEKQHVRDHEFKTKLSIALKEAERKQKERALLRERQFEERIQNFCVANSTLIRDVEGAIQADETWRHRKRERLYNEWSQMVFQPMQDEINRQLSELSEADIEVKRRAMFQAFLDESNKKANGLFRDIIIESDYNPLAHQQHASVRYKMVSDADDPCKNRATREMGDRITRTLLQKESDGKEGDNQRALVKVEMWDRMESTPYGRYSNSDYKLNTKPNFLRSNVHMDHYDVAKGNSGASLLKEENNVRGKKMVKPIFSSKRSKTEGFQLGTTPPPSNGQQVPPLPPLPVTSSSSTS